MKQKQSHAKIPLPDAVQPHQTQKQDVQPMTDSFTYDVFFTASLKKKVNRSKTSLALRVCCQARNIHARNQGLLIYKNIRVPKNSCVYETYETGKACLASENLNIWTTSAGKSGKTEMTGMLLKK